MSVITRTYDRLMKAEWARLPRTTSTVNEPPFPGAWSIRADGTMVHTKKSTVRTEWLTQLPLDRADAERLAFIARERLTDDATVGHWCLAVYSTTHDEGDGHGRVRTIGVRGCSACRWRVRMMIGLTAIHLAWRKFEAKEGAK